MEKIIIFTDGGARNNPGPAGIGIVFYDEEGKIIKEYSEYIGETTNNQAEYRALIKALELVQAYSSKEIECYLDSELVVKQLNKEYRVKNEEVKKLYAKVLDSIIFKNISFHHVPREKNKLADRLVNKAINAQMLK